MMWSLAAWVTSRLHLLRPELVADAGQHQVHDLADLVLGERAEDDRGVDAVEELGPEGVLELAGTFSRHPVVGGLGARSSVSPTGPEAERRVRLELPRADVARS